MRTAILTLIPLLLFFLGGCSKGTGETTVRIGTNTWPGYESLYLAAEQGFYPEKRVRLKRMASASEVLQAFRNGTVDMAALTLDEVLILKDQGYDPKVILILDFSHGGDVIIAREGIADMKALKGKRVGFENTALGAYVLERALELNGMHFSDIIPLPAAYSEHLNFFQNHIIDAVVTFEPVRTKLLNSGGKEIFDSSMIPGEIVDVLVVREKLLSRHPGLVKTVIDGWKKAYTLMHDQPDATAALIAQKQHITPAEFTDSLRGLELPGVAKNLEYLDGDAPKLLETLKKLHRVMKEKHLLTAGNPIELKGLLYKKQGELMAH